MKNVWNGAISLAMLDNQKCVACKFCFTEQSETNSLEPYIFFFKITYLSKNFFFFTQTPILAPIIPNFYVFILSRQWPAAAPVPRSRSSWPEVESHWLSQSTSQSNFLKLRYLAPAPLAFPKVWCETKCFKICLRKVSENQFWKHSYDSLLWVREATGHFFKDFSQASLYCPIMRVLFFRIRLYNCIMLHKGWEICRQVPTWVS